MLLDAAALTISLLVGIRSCLGVTFLELILIVALGTGEYFADIEVVEVSCYNLNLKLELQTTP